MPDPENLQAQLMQLIMQADFTSIDGSVTMMDEIMSLLAQMEEAGGAVSPEIEGLLELMMQMQALAVNTDAALMAKDYDGAEALLGDIEGITGVSYADDPPLSAEADAVFDAIEAGDIAGLKTALVGFDVNAGHGTFGATPLYRAMSDFEPSADIIGMLRAQGADPALGLVGDSTVLHGAAFGNYGDWDQRDVNDLVTSCCTACEGLLQIRTPKLGWTPLHFALMESNREIAIACLKNGADPNERFGTTNPPTYGSGDTPLHAIFYQSDLVALLLDNGADASLHNTAGQTVIEAAQAALSGEIDADFAADVQASLDLIKARNTPN